MSLQDTPSVKKARGAFFTPSQISDYLAAWAIRAPSDTVLEPSCGEASFLLAAGKRLQVLGASQFFWSHQLHGIEIHEESARNAHRCLSGAALDADIRVADFFDCAPSTKYDAVIGNPPYVRYQQFVGNARARSAEVALAQGVRLTGLASSWASFVVHASAFLKRGGRLGLVLPAELLSVNYAAEVRRYLLKRFASVRLIMFEKRIFPGVLEEVVLLLAEGSGGAKCIELYQTRGLDGLSGVDTVAWTAHEAQEYEKWTPALLSRGNLATYKSLSSGDGFSVLLDWGDTYLGAVTGNNQYFALTQQDVMRLSLADEDLVRISPPGARHLRGLTFASGAWKALAKAGERSFLFYPRSRLNARTAAYVALGEKDGVHNAYKCAVRSPWWRVPLVDVPDLFLTYMNHDRPRLITNEASVHILNSLYGIKLRDERRKLGRKLLPIACLNSVTLLGAEVVGRTYGGGLLKLEPKEAGLLPIPSEMLLIRVADRLKNIKPQLSVVLRQNNVAGAVEMVDRVILQEALDIPEKEIVGLRTARAHLFERRRSRGRANGGTN